MKKFSNLDLFKSSVLSNTGELLGKIFESKYVTLTITVPEYDYKRGLILVSDVNDVLKQERKNNPDSVMGVSLFTISKLFNLLYTDFLRQVQEGVYSDSGKKEKIELSTLAKSLIMQKNMIGAIDKEMIKSLEEVRPNHYILTERSVHKNKQYNPIISVPISILKKHVLRGEVLLYDLYEKFPELDMTLEELISIRYRSVIKDVKDGNYNVLYAIVQTLL